MMVRWMCGVSLKDRKQSQVFYSFLGIQSVAEVVRHDKLRWFGHLERKSGMIGCWPVEMWRCMAGERCVGTGQGKGDLERLCK